MSSPTLDVNDLLAVLQDLYPQQLNHAISETRARTAEARVAQLEDALRDHPLSNPSDVVPSSEDASEAPE